MKLEDLIETAQLARINLEKAELERIFPAFERMVDFLDLMRTADGDEKAFGGSIAGIKESRHRAGAGHFRRDVPDNLNTTDNSSRALVEEMLRNAGERNGQFIVVPNVL